MINKLTDLCLQVELLLKMLLLLHFSENIEAADLYIQAIHRQINQTQTLNTHNPTHSLRNTGIPLHDNCNCYTYVFIASHKHHKFNIIRVLLHKTPYGP